MSLFEALGHFSELHCAEGVILDRLPGLNFHHGHMLVGGSMEDDLGFELLKNVFDSGPIEDISDERNDSIAKSGMAKEDHPRAIQARAELGLIAKARSLKAAAVERSPVRISIVAAAIHSTSGSSGPVSMARFAKVTASSASTSETGLRPCETWWMRDQPISAAAGA